MTILYTVLGFKLRPLEIESPPITTRPGPPEYLYIILHVLT